MNRVILALLLLFSFHHPYCQGIEEFISQGISNSYQIRLAKNELQIAEAAFSIYRVAARPTLNINGNIPAYNKDYSGIIQPDGTIKFLRRSQNYSNAGFSIAQPLPFTGGTLSLNTDLYRFDDLVAKNKQYNGTPAFLQLQQPLFAYNRFKWDKQIEPLKLQEAKLNLALQTNQFSYDVCRVFFDVLDAQSNRQLAAVNLDNAVVNLTQEKRKLQLGTSAEDKVLQLEIQQLNSQREIEAAELAIQSAFAGLRLIVNNKDTLTYELRVPESLPILQLNREQLIEEAKKQLPVYISFQRKLLEAKSNTAQVKAQNNQVNLMASYGLTNSAGSVPGIYQNPNDQQRFSIGFSVPLITWGKKKNSITAARLQEKQVELNNKAEEAKLVAEITSILNELPLLQKNVASAKRIDTLTQKRYIVANRLFQTGKTSLLELQAAQTEKDNARRNYLLALRRFWEGWYLVKAKINTVN